MIDNTFAMLGPALVLQNSFLTTFTMAASLIITEKKNSKGYQFKRKTVKLTCDPYT